MKKFKIISSICALVLVMGLFAFGVYAATSTSFSIKSKVFFEVTDVYVKVNYGIENVEDFGPYYSHESRGTPLLNSVQNLPKVVFTEEDYTCTYYITIENLHNQDIYLRLGYNWLDSTKYDGDAIVVESKLLNDTTQTESDIEDIQTSNRENGVTKSSNKYETGQILFRAKEVITLKVSLKMLEDSMDYSLNGGLTLRVSAGLNEAPSFE